MPFKNDRAPLRLCADVAMSASDYLEVYSESSVALNPPRSSTLRLIHSTNEMVGRPALAPPTSASGTDKQDTEMHPEKYAAMLDRGLQARIGAMLREVFGDVASAPVPDRFVGLLEALAAKDKPRE